MEIAIVDDNADDRQEVQTIFCECIDNLMPALLPSLHFSEFGNAESFLNTFKPNKFSLVLLDIYMDKLNGIDAAQAIRAQGDDCQIIFLTTSTEHLLAGYTVFAAGYLLKPLHRSSNNFLHVIEHCLPQLLESQYHLDVIVDTMPLTISLRQLIYIDCNNSRKVVLHMFNGQAIHTQSHFHECADVLLSLPDFLECYHRVIINMKYIDSMNDETFTLANKESVPISRRKKNQVKQHYMLYLIKK